MTDIVDLTEARMDRERALLPALLRARVAPSLATHCDDCGEEIPADRREAAPFATRCIDCQIKFERTT